MLQTIDRSPFPSVRSRNVVGMKFMVVLFVLVAMASANPERERRSVWGWPVVGAVPAATAVIGPKAGPVAVIGPNAGAAVVSAAAPAVVAARVPAAAVVAGPAGAVFTHGAVVAPHFW